jgi:hypothetical protein
LEYLIYEKAFNLRQIDDDKNIDYYNFAMKIAEFNNKSDYQ